ncbi:MAG: hypothetical protein SVV80_09815, partial [Planctomycetota bacterium]|nr:hypothetical protein [Planctomycetota bacterium]
QATGYRLQATGYRLQATGYRLQATGYRLQATGYRLQATGYCTVEMLMVFDDLVTGGIRAKLNSLKWTLRANLLGIALAWIVLALVAAIFLTLGIDYALHMDRAQRGLMSILSLGGVAFVVWRFALRPLRVPMDAEELALVMEKHYSDLGDRLISTLQFAAGGLGTRGASEILIRKVADQTGELMEDLDARGPVESRRTWKLMSLPAGALIILMLYSACYSQVMGLWFKRNVLFADVPWPQETYLTIEGGREVNGRLVFKVVRGRNLNVTVRANDEHVVPNEVTYHMDFPGLGAVAENVTGAGDKGNVYIKTFENVAEAFKFYVTGNDDRTGNCYVTVVDPPELLDVKFTIDYPAYMKRPQTSLDVERGVLSIPPGSRVALSGRSNKPLAGARLLLNGKEAAPLRLVGSVDLSEPYDQAGPKGIEGYFYLPERPDKSSVKLQFELTDTEGITNLRGAAYAIRIEPDRPPSASMNRTGVRADVTARALIPLVIHGRDDYGVAGFEVCVAPVAPSMTTTAPATKKFPVPGVPVIPEARVTYELDVEPMKLEVGSVVRVHTVVSDTLPETFGGPNRSQSLVQAFKIVSEEELMAELVRLQKEASQEFLGCVVLQGEVRDKVRATCDRLNSMGLDAEVRRELAVAAKAQGRVAAQCAVAAQRFGDILEEMNCNRIGTPIDKRRLSAGIIKPLLEISKKPMIDMVASLTRASKETDAVVVGRIATPAAETLGAFHETLEKIHKEMDQGIRRQELENHLKVVIKVGTKILNDIRLKAKKDTGTIFDTTTQPGKDK